MSGSPASVAAGGAARAAGGRSAVGTSVRPGRRWPAVAVLALAQVVLVLDNTVVNIALPSIQAQFGLDEASLAWVVNGYSLAFGGFLLLGGRMADLYGRRRMFMTGMALFSGASLVAGLAWSAEVVVAMRFVQGMAAAIAAPAAVSLVSRIFTEPKERARALGLLGGLTALSATLGAVLSGVLVQYLSWRWVFLVTVPLTLLALLLAPRLVPESVSPDDPHLDVVGAFLVTTGIGVAALALLDQGTGTWGDPTFLLRVALAALLLTAFVVRESRTPHPMVPLSVFKHRNRAAGVGAAVVLGSVVTAYFFSTTLYMQSTLDYSPLQTGVAYLPFGLAVVATFPFVTMLVPRVGLRVVMPVGLLLASAGAVFVTTVDVAGTYTGDVLPGMLLIGAGAACGFATFTIAGVDGTTDADAGIAAGVLNAGSQVGNSLGLATFVAVALSVRAEEISQGTPVAEAAVDGFTTTSWLAAAILLVAAVATAVLLRPPTPAEPVIDLT